MVIYKGSTGAGHALLLRKESLVILHNFDEKLHEVNLNLQQKKTRN